MLRGGGATIRRMNVSWKEKIQNTSYLEISPHQGEVLTPALKGLRERLEQLCHSLPLFSHTHVASEGLCLFI